MRTTISLVLLLAAAVPSLSAQEAHGRGYIPPTKAVQAARSAAMSARHDSRMALLPKQTDATFDIVAKGWAIPVGDQASCGSCWLYSAVLNISSAYVKAGYGANWRFSYQHMMDCGPNGDPCGGGDEYDIFQVAKSDGLVTEADYGVAYKAAKGPCRYAGQKKWKIGDFLYVDPAQQSGRSSTQSIKNAMVSYGMVSIAIDASRFDSYTGGVMTTGQNIDHAVNAVGWDDGKQVMQEKKTPLDLPKLASTGAFKVQNQWGNGWGLQGFGWVSYASYLVEGIVCSVTALPPPPPDPTPTPTPTPTAITGVVTIKITGQSDQSFQFNIPATVPPSGGVTIPAEQFKALQDEVKKLQDLLSQQQVKGAAPCGEVKAVKDRLDALEKRIDADKAATNKNLSDILDIADMNRKAIIELRNKVGATKTEPMGRVEALESSLVVVLPPSKQDAVIYVQGRGEKHRTNSTGLRRLYETTVGADGSDYIVTASLNGVEESRRALMWRGKTTTVDFSSIP